MTMGVCHNKNMLIFKKLIFAIPFLICFYLFIFLLLPYFQNLYLFFELSINALINLLFLLSALILSSIFFAILIALNTNFKFILPIIIVASIAPMIVFPSPINLILGIGFLIVFGLIFLNLKNTLAKYFSFQANFLLNPSTKTIVSLIILVSSFGFYLTANLEIKQNGFKIPDSLVETAIKLSGNADSGNIQNTQVNLPKLTVDQYNSLKNNPLLLQQFGVDSTTLELLNPAKQSSSSTKATSTSQNLLKSAAEEQFNKMLEPYKDFIPLVLALLFFLTLYSTASLLTIFNPLFIGGIFYLLEKSGFVRFTTEMREVKKLII